LIRDERSTGTFPARSSAQIDEQPGGVFSVGVWIAVVAFGRAAGRAGLRLRFEQLLYRLKAG